MGDISTFLDNKRVPLKEDDRKQMKGKYPYYGASGIIDYIDDYIFDEELILMGEDGANIVTRSSKLIFLAKGKYWVNNHAHVIKANSDINQYFLSESLERINYEKYNTGTAQPKLNRDVCQKIKVKIPEYSEQNKIASFLVQIDQKIKLLEQKYKNYKNFKKYLMQQIFAQKLRFNFDDKWNKYNLGDISTIGKGFTPSTSNPNYWDGDIDWLSIADMNQGKYITETSKKITEEGCKNKKIVEKDTLIMSFKLTIGRLSILKKDMFTNEAICNFKWKNNDILTEYMYYYLSSINILKYGSQAAKGITLNNDTLSTIPVLLPSIEEQEKIVDIMSNMDTKIQFIENNIEDVKKFKKGLLQQMFVYFRIKFLISVRKFVALNIF